MTCRRRCSWPSASPSCRRGPGASRRSSTPASTRTIRTSSRASRSSTRSTKSGTWCAPKPSRHKAATRKAPTRRERVAHDERPMTSALIRYLPLVLLAVAWEAASQLGLVSSLALPPLSKVIVAWVDLLKDGDLVANGLSSIYRAAAGLALAIVIGAALGIAMAWWRPLNVLLGPLVALFYPMPKSALLPVTVR